MKLIFKDLDFYFLTCDEKRKKHMYNEFKEFNLIQVSPILGIDKVMSGITGMSKILDLASQKKIFKPFVIFEDDVKKFREFDKFIETPDNIDILYIGISNHGLNENIIGKPGIVCFENKDKNFIRVYNMLSTHGIIICSIRGLISFQKCLFEDYFKKRPYDISICNIQPYLNVYALKEPFVYQYELLGGQEFATKLTYLNQEDKKYPNNWLTNDDLSVKTLKNI